MSDPPPEISADPPAFDPPGYGASSSTFEPNVLVEPLEDRTSFLDDQNVRGVVYVKGLTPGWGVTKVLVRLRLTDRLPPDNDLDLILSDWQTAFQSSPTNPSNPFPSEKNRETPNGQPEHSFPFSIPLSSSFGGDGDLPGCIHLMVTGLGDVLWRLEVKVEAASAAGEMATYRNDVEIHITPCRKDGFGTVGMEMGIAGPSGTGASGSGTQRYPDRESVSIAGTTEAGSACKLVMSSRATSTMESIAVGVEIGGGRRISDPEAVTWLKGLRRVRLEWYRRVRVPMLDAGPSSSSSAPAYKEYLTLMHKSGKSCRYSSNPAKPIRLLFELPPLHNILSNNYHASGLSGVTCGDITQRVGRHEVDFFVRAIIEGRGMESDTPTRRIPSTSTTYSSEVDAQQLKNAIVLQQGLQVYPPTWSQLAPTISIPTDEPSGAGQAEGESAEGVPTNLIPQEDEVPQTMEDLQRAYRLKGRDLVGDTGTYRLPESTAGPSTSADPPPFAESDIPPPFAAMEGMQRDAPPFAARETGELPSFDESQRQRRATITSLQGRDDGPSQSTGPQPQSSGFTTSTQTEEPLPTSSRSTPAPAALTGELALWREYDGYETFSAPPPTALVSLGLSGSMDPPNAYDYEGEHDHGPATRPDERRRLVEQLGLGEGTRVIDTQEDMPPGFDEPSLPALPGAMTHQRFGAGGARIRNRSRSRAGLEDLEEVESVAGLAVPLSEHGHDISPPAHEDTAPPPAFFSHTHQDYSDPPPPAISPPESSIPPPPIGQAHLPPPSFAASEAAEARGIPASTSPTAPGPPIPPYHTHNPSINPLSFPPTSQPQSQSQQPQLQPPHHSSAHQHQHQRETAQVRRGVDLVAPPGYSREAMSAGGRGGVSSSEAPPGYSRDH